MAEPDEIAARVAQLLAPPTLAGRRVLVTAGGTREAVDAVRFVGNRSSGRMGVALAEEARAARGGGRPARRANLSVAAPAGVEVVATPTAEAMLDAAVGCRRSTWRCWRRRSPTTGLPTALATKRPKGGEPWTLELEPTADIARLLGERKREGQVLVAFGAELGAEGLERKRRMLGRQARRPRRLQRRLARRHRLRRRRQRGRARLARRRPAGAQGLQSAIAAAILDEAERSARMSDAYENFQEGRRRLKKGMPAQATVVLEKAKTLEPEKASIREALGIAYFRLARWQEAEAEFRAVLELVAYGRLRALRARPHAREAGPPGRGERPLQARQLDGPGSAQYAARIQELD